MTVIGSFFRSKESQARQGFPAIGLWVGIGCAFIVLSALGCVTADRTGSDGAATPVIHPYQVVREVPPMPTSSQTPATDASPPKSIPGLPRGAFGFSRYVFEDVGGEVMATLVEGPLGEQVRSPLSYRQLRDMQENDLTPAMELGMSASEVAELVVQLDDLRNATEKYQDVAQAQADGFGQVGQEVPNMGAHFMNIQRMQDGTFDPSLPEILMYSRDEKGEWVLRGTAFVLLTQQVGEEHPSGFAGTLDNWHVHYSICGGGPDVEARSATREDCEAQGGFWAPSFGWMVHAWVWDDNPMGVFSMWNPNVRPLASEAEVRRVRDLSESTEMLEAVSISNVEHASLSTQAGRTVEWTNLDGLPHTVTLEAAEGQPGADSGLIAPGQSFGLRFDRPGEYLYACTLHPTMRGSILVTR